MLNRSGITKVTYGAPTQILANVENQISVGCIIPQSMSTDTTGKKIVKAGTPINIDMTNLQAVAKAPVEASEGVTSAAMNAVLLHDVDVTEGNANGTALIFGVVNLNRVDSSVAAAITTAKAISGASPLLLFVKQ